MGLKATINEQQIDNINAIEELKSEIESIQESNKSMIKIYEYQHEAFRERVVKEFEYLNKLNQNSDLNSSSDHANLINELAQRDAVSRTLKEENKDLKLEISKLKTKPKELKIKPTKQVSKIDGKSKASVVQKSAEPDEISYQDYHEILSRIALVESANIKLTSKSYLVYSYHL